MPDPVSSNYPVLLEHSMEHMDVLHVDVDDLEDGLYHPNVVDFHYCHQGIAKDQEWDGMSCLEVGMFYPAELESVYYKDNKTIEGLARLLD